MADTERPPHRLGRLALRFWAISTGLFLLAFVVGIVASATGPGGDTVRTWASLVFPAVVSLASTPLLVVALVLSIRSFAVEGFSMRALVAHILSLLTLLPLAFIFLGVAALLTGNG